MRNSLLCIRNGASLPNNFNKINTIYWNLLNLCYIYSQLFHKEIELVRGIISGCINRRYPLEVELFHWQWYKDKYPSWLKIALSFLLDETKNYSFILKQYIQYTVKQRVQKNCQVVHDFWALWFCKGDVWYIGWLLTETKE